MTIRVIKKFGKKKDWGLKKKRASNEPTEYANHSTNIGLGPGLVKKSPGCLKGVNLHQKTTGYHLQEL